MGMVAARLSDVVVITSDNPRSEDPARIIEEVKRGAEPETRQSNAEVLTIVDRREAILQAVARASAGDVVLIAGKGHEKYQEIGGRDAAVRRRGGGAGGAGGAAREVAGRVSELRADARRGWRDAVGGADRDRAIRSGEIGDVVTDSRTLQPGDFFVALRGPRFDGHDVRRRGARARRGRRRSSSGGSQARRRQDRRPRRAAGVDRGRRHAEGAAGPGARGADGGGHEGGRDHRQRGQDDDEGSDRGVSGRRASAW